MPARPRLLQCCPQVYTCSPSFFNNVHIQLKQTLSTIQAQQSQVPYPTLLRTRFQRRDQKSESDEDRNGRSKLRGTPAVSCLADVTTPEALCQTKPSLGNTQAFPLHAACDADSCGSTMLGYGKCRVGLGRVIADGIATVAPKWQYIPLCFKFVEGMGAHWGAIWSPIKLVATEAGPSIRKPRKAYRPKAAATQQHQRVCCLSKKCRGLAGQR